MDMPEVKQVELSALSTDAFTPRAGECRAAFARRLFDEEANQEIDDGVPSKIIAIMKAMAKGEAIPPVVITALPGEPLGLVDGWHRCAAAACLGRESINAIVFPCESVREADLIGLVAFELLHTMEAA